MSDLFDVKIVGLTNAMRAAAVIEERRLAFAHAVAEAMAHRVRSEIRSRTGALAGSWTGEVRGDGQAVVSSHGVVYAKASVGGVYHLPKRAQALHFADGRFRMWSRINPGAWIGDPSDRKTSYVDKAFAHFREVVAAEFKLMFGRKL